MADIPTHCPDCGAKRVSESVGAWGMACCRWWYGGGWSSRLSTCYELQLAKMKAEIDRMRAYDSAMRNSGLDVSPCCGCGEPVVCLPDGMAGWCVKCAEAAKEQADEHSV
ncbi:MAG TPA: hypothetical protein VM487_22045 [Phycisphaerae bacterium]|nr:hypothetical protein [Phycisphaerae bacterium]